MVSLLSAPAQLPGLRLENNGSSDSLRGSWAPPEGAVERYLLTLSAADAAATGSPPQRRVLPPNATQATFQGLTPGRRYQLSVQTAAAGLSTETRTWGRTGESGAAFRGTGRSEP